jgi:hypothetical protein
MGSVQVNCSRQGLVNGWNASMKRLNFLPNQRVHVNRFPNEYSSEPRGTKRILWEGSADDETRPCVADRCSIYTHVKPIQAFQRFGPTLNLMWDHDEDFNRGFLKERPLSHYLLAQRNLDKKNKCFSFLVSLGVSCLEATVTSSSIHRIQNHANSNSLTLLTVFDEFSTHRIPLVLLAVFHGLPSLENEESEGRSFSEVVQHMDRIKELPCGNNCDVT